MTEPKTRILVVDDDLRLRDLLQRYLTEQGFGVHTVPDAAGMDKLLGRERVDLLVLDLMLPREVVARINAVLHRRAAPLPPGAPAVEPEKISFGNMTVNLATRKLERDGQSMSLTTSEFAPLARQIDGARAGPRIRSVRPFDRRPGVAPAQARREGSRESCLHPDHMGVRLRLRARRPAAMKAPTNEG